MTSLRFPPYFFVTGTDTDVGKTLVSATLTYGLKAGYWKPIQSGNQPPTDTQWVQEVTQLPKHHFFPEQYVLKHPLAPTVSASLEGVSISLDKLQLPDKGSLPHLVVEGAGGIMVPINEQHYIIDLIKKWQLPVLIVARSGLGTINHTLLTINELKREKIPIIGVILNGFRNPANRNSIERYGKVPILGEFEPLATVTPKALDSTFKLLNMESC